MSQYDFDPKRCKAALELLANLVNQRAVPEEHNAIGALFLDIEALHAAAQERDQLADGIIELSPIEFTDYGMYYDESEVDELIDFLFVDNERKRIADMNL